MADITDHIDLIDALKDQQESLLSDIQHPGISPVTKRLISLEIDAIQLDINELARDALRAVMDTKYGPSEFNTF